MSEERSEERAIRPNWLAGRSNRREYWILIAIVFGLSVVLNLFMPDKTSSTATGALLLLIQVRRFHDLGRSGWWALALLVAQVAAVVPLVLLASGDTLVLVAAVVSLVPLIILGAIPGQGGENFGPPPGRPDLAETFS